MSNEQQPPNEIKPEERALLLDHNYDGIQELDHPLPRWWITIFYLTIIFAGLYVGYYMAGPGPSLRQELEIALKEIELKRPKEVAIVIDAKESSKEAVPIDHIGLGKKVYATRCTPCHGAQGEGGIGPNLTDEYWIHGKGAGNDLAKLVQNGVSEKGMPAWKDVLQLDEIKDVVIFVMSLHGTKPNGAKAPQGQKF